MYPFEAISMRRKLGGGAFGDVFEVLVGGDMVAAMKVSSDAAVDAGALDHERALLESLPPHANVVTVWGLCTDAPDGKLRVIMELCQPGSVKDFIRSAATDGCVLVWCAWLSTVWLFLSIAAPLVSGIPVSGCVISGQCTSGL